MIHTYSDFWRHEKPFLPKKKKKKKLQDTWWKVRERLIKPSWIFIPKKKRKIRENFIYLFMWKLTSLSLPYNQFNHKQQISYFFFHQFFRWFLFVSLLLLLCASWLVWFDNRLLNAITFMPFMHHEMYCAFDFCFFSPFYFVFFHH